MKFLKRVFWKSKAFFASLVYGFPARKLILIGVTGTDGKTSTTSLIAHILQQNNLPTAYISTVGAKIGNKMLPVGFHVTTPRFFALHRYLAQAVKQGIKYVVLEVTSHALDQERVRNCQFKIGVLTNITNEHLDYHGSFDNYAKTKLRLINTAEMAVVNTEAPTFYRYRKLITNKNVWYTSLHKKSEVSFSKLVKQGLRTDWADFEKENLLLAFTTGRLLGIEADQIIKAINSFIRVKGRLDYFKKDNYQFLVDFAHTPNAFVQLYKAIKQQAPQGRIIHVFGCAGLRDKEKRAKMGFIASNNAQMIIITEEDYRTEKIEQINAQIEVGIKKNKAHHLGKTYFMIPNRQEAINFAIKQAKPDDLIVLTGKAHEQSLARGKKEWPWDEYQAIDQALKQAS